MRRSAAFLVLLGSAASSVAAPEGASGADANSISQASRDFEAIQATRAGTPDAKTDAPQIDAPEMLAPEGVNGGRAPLLTGPVAKPVNAPGASANWLVDALVPTPGNASSAVSSGVELARQAAPNSARPSSREPLGSATATANRPGVLDRAGAATGPRSAAGADFGGAAKPAVANPLSGYMAGWMTPADFALLKPAGGNLATGELGDSLRDSVAAGVSGESSWASAQSGNPGGSDVISAPRLTTPTLADNPYLQDLAATLHSPSSALTSAPILSTTAPAPVVPLLQSRSPVETPASTIPAFAQPPEDAKYFKPLKRF